MQVVERSIPGLEGINEHIVGVMRDWGVPGLAVGIVKDGELAFAKGYGLRDVKAGQPVTPNTVFAIGSNSKSFTATALAILVDDGKLDWDTPVREYLPEFRLYDRVATELATPIDLLTHRIGLPDHVLAFYGSTLSRRDLFERLRYLEPNKSFRFRFEYSNLSYLAAGMLIEAVSDQTWEAFVRDRIFTPLGMTNSNFSVEDTPKGPDYALPYGEKDGKAREIPFRNIDATGPAGSINSSVVDVAKWLLFHLNKGKVADQQIVSEAQLAKIHTPHIIPDVQGHYPEVPLGAYGLGLGVSAYRGYKLLAHAGGIDGFISTMSFMPAEGLGIVVLTNQGDYNSSPVAVDHDLYDRLLGLESRPWSERLREDLSKMREMLQAGKGKVEHIEDTHPSRDLDGFTGSFEHPGYGALTIGRDENGLRFKLNAIDEPLGHRHYDVFDLDYARFGMHFPVTFLTGTKGDVDRVSAPLQTGVSDIVFTRVPPDAMRDPDFLEQFAGTYELLGMGMAVAVTVKGDILVVAMPGQPEVQLVPYGGMEFTVKGQSGTTVHFDRDEHGAVTGLTLTQLQGTITAVRK